VPVARGDRRGDGWFELNHSQKSCGVV
jgi:hypothetical protein